MSRASKLFIECTNNKRTINIGDNDSIRSEFYIGLNKDVSNKILSVRIEVVLQDKNEVIYKAFVGNRLLNRYVLNRKNNTWSCTKPIEIVLQNTNPLKNTSKDYKIVIKDSEEYSKSINSGKWKYKGEIF